MSAVERSFPYVTLVLRQQSWPPVIPAAVKHLSQRVVLHTTVASLREAEGTDARSSLMGLLHTHDVLVEEDTDACTTAPVYDDMVAQSAAMNLYVISKCKEPQK